MGTVYNEFVLDPSNPAYERRPFVYDVFAAELQMIPRPVDSNGRPNLRQRLCHQ